MKTKSYIAVILILIIFLLISFNASSEDKKVPIYSVDTPEKKISLTFNCAWGDEDIQDILNTLKAENVKCTFFIVGEFARRCPQAVSKIYADGHELANHSDTHRDMTILSQSEIIDDISACNESIVKLTGFTPVLFRSPSGAYDNKTIEAAESLSMQAIQWNIDSLDWQGLDCEIIINRITAKAESGSIVLLHTGTKNTAASLPKLISLLKKEYTIVTVSELIYKTDFRINPINGIQTKQP